MAAIVSNISYEDRAITMGHDDIAVTLEVDDISTSLLNNEITITIALWDRDIDFTIC